MGLNTSTTRSGCLAIDRSPVSRLRRWSYAGVGLICLGLGGVGIVVPGLPTTVFWIVAAWMFGKSCPVLQRWVYRRPRVGPVIERLLVHGQMDRASKRRALAGMWAGMLGSCIVVVMLGGAMWVPGVIVACGVGATLWITRGIETVSAPACSH